MERKYKRNVVVAVRESASLKGSAKRFGINVMALKGIVRRGEVSLPGFQKSLIFTKEEEAELAEYLLRASKMYYGLTLKKLRELPYDFGLKNNKKLPKSWETGKITGKDWTNIFLERNKNLSLRVPEATSLVRSSVFNKHTVGVFFETGVSTIHKPGKIMAMKGIKQVGILTS